MPDKEALAVYLRRMREQGWDVSPTIRKAIACGADIMPEVHLAHAVDMQGCLLCCMVTAWAAGAGLGRQPHHPQGHRVWGRHHA